MKILQVNKYHYPRGGADRYYLDLGSRLEKAGHEVAYFSMEHPLNQPTPWSKYFVSRVSFNENVRHYAWKIPGRTIYSLEAKRQFSRLLDDFKPDVIHLHNIYHQISPSILDAATKRNIPVIMHAHDFKLVCPNHSLFVKGQVCERCLKGNYSFCTRNRCVKDSLPASILASLEMYIHHDVLKIYEKNIAQIIAPSNFMKQILLKAGWADNKVTVVNNPFSYLEQAAHSAPGDYFLFAGRLSAEKGIEVALKAVKGTDLRLVVAGAGLEESGLKKIAEADQNISFVGWQQGAALSALIAGAKAVIIPSLWYENFPLIALEALSCGVPVIASDIGGLPEIVNERNGLLFKAGNFEALREAMLAIDNHDRPWNKQEIIDSASIYSEEINTNSVLAVYRQNVK